MIDCLLALALDIYKMMLMRSSSLMIPPIWLVFINKLLYYNYYLLFSTINFDKYLGV